MIGMMKTRRKEYRGRLKCRLNRNGSTLVLAIFMLVVFGFLGVSLVSMLTVNTTGSVEELSSIQALFTAESGVEIAITECVRNGTCSGTTTYQFEDGKSATVAYGANLTLDSDTIYVVQSKGVVNNAVRQVRIKFK